MEEKPIADKITSRIINQQIQQRKKNINKILDKDNALDSSETKMKNKLALIFKNL
ncbi:hypothetical protein HYD94_03075 [Mycoplasmopsis bovis]|nr:hypothetical protein [Mycoplasmopsis bovis]QQH35002.1 hypothetical protein HYD94_03075 [Mycoplasmopsis bovis]